MRIYGELRKTNFGDAWLMQADPQVHMRAKRVFGKISSNTVGVLQLPMNQETARDLEWFMERYPLAMTDADRAELVGAATQHKDLIATLEQLLVPGYQPPTFDMCYQPRTYQALEAEIYRRQGGVLIADDVGLGKTVTGICTFMDKRTLPAVVVTLAHLPKQWGQEVNTFAPDLFVWSPKSKTPTALPSVFGHGPDVIILNYHKLSGWADVLGAYANSVIFDEAQELRHRGTAKYKAAQYLCEKVKFRMGLSATPIFNYGGEIYSVLDLLRPGCLGSWTEFLTEWCGGEGRHDKKPKLKDAKAFGSWAREQFLIVRHTRADVGRELPAVINIPQHVDCNPKALDQVKNTAAELAQLILRQGSERVRGEKFLASQELDNLLRQATGIAKAPFVADFVRLLVESGEKVLLGGWHRAVYDIWLAKLADYKPVLYTGSEDALRKECSRQAFMRGDTPICIMSLRSGAGTNGFEQVSSCAVLGELDWSPGVHEQFIGRLNRDGQRNPVVAYFLIADEGSDPEISSVLGLKRQQVEGIRNPTQDFLEKLELDGEQIKRLARSYLKQIGKPVAPVMEAVCP